MAEFIMLLAATFNNVIGNNDGLVCNIPTDLARFKRITDGQYILMGRKTFETLPSNLNNRKICVLSKTMSTEPGKYGDNVTVFRSIEEIESSISERIYVCGGAEIYKATLDKCNTVMLTVIQTMMNVPNSVYFHDLSDIKLDWYIKEIDFPIHVNKDEYPTTYITYTRPSTTVTTTELRCN